MCAGPGSPCWVRRGWFNSAATRLSSIERIAGAGVWRCVYLANNQKQENMTLGEALLSNLGGTSANSLTHILELNNVEENSDNQNLILQESPYYDCDSFKTLIHPVDIKTINFSILSTNIQSIHAKFNELQTFVKDMQSVPFNFSVICIQESWLKDADDTSLKRPLHCAL